MAEQEPDITNFSTPSSHRLPTVSATQALEVAVQKAKRAPTGLPGLDDILRADNGRPTTGGVPRGQVTEIYGPPGVGKTTLALQVAINAIHSFDDQNHVIWINTGSALAYSRVKSFVTAYRTPTGQEPPSSPTRAQPTANVLAKFDCIDALTLPRLLTLFLHPTATFPPPQTTLVVVDDLSNLIHGSFPKTKAKTANATLNLVREKQAQKAAGRKWAVLAEIATAMSRIAVVRNIAVLVVNQTATSLTKGEKARLRPALTSPPWNLAVRNRILLYRDFLSAESAAGLPPPIAHQMRFAEVVKSNGRERNYGHSPTPFVIRKGGVREVSLNNKSTSTTVPPTSINVPAKRKADEIADSEDEGDEIASDDDLGLPVEDEDDSDVEITGDNNNRRPAVVTASQQLAYENGMSYTDHGRHDDQEDVSLPVRPSPRKSQILLKGSEDYLTQADEEDDEEPLTNSDNDQDLSGLN